MQLSSLTRKFIAREDRFFEKFEKLSDKIVMAAAEFDLMLSDLSKAEFHSRKIKDIEHEADDITHSTMALLHKTFITPIDREDIHRLVTTLDDIVDFIDAAASRMYLYEIKKVPDGTKQLIQVCIQSGELIRKAVSGLRDLKDPNRLMQTCVEINRLENEADHVLRSSMAKLFREEQDVRQLIKSKELLEMLETVTDRCEDVANTIEGIVLEYA